MKGAVTIMSVFYAPIRFFLGSQTPDGFADSKNDLYEYTDDWRVWLIKGGAGTGKSTLLRRVYAALGDDVQTFCCSADPASLDGICCPARCLCVLDATAPHAIEPTYWGVPEQPLSLSACLDLSRLRERGNEIRQLTDACGSAHRTVRRHLQAAAALLSQNRQEQQAALLPDKIRRTARGIARREWGSRTTGGGKTLKRFLSAITPLGPLTFYETLQALCPRIYTIEDECGSAGELLLKELTRLAVEAGLTCYVCPCPLFPQAAAQHLLIPSIGLAFTVSNTFHKADFPTYRRLHVSRFTDAEFAANGARAKFRRRAATELINAATEAAAQAKVYHDQLEEINRRAMNWDAFEQTVQFLLKEIG